jgi:transcriptional regulator with XRE-family HTH domain
MGKGTDPYDIEVGRRIRARRLARQMSQMELGHQLGLTFQQVQKYEKGANRVGAGRLKRIARILDAPIPYFFGDAGESGSEEEEVSDFMRNARMLRLLRAYARIPDERVQQSLLDLTEKIARDARAAANSSGLTP